ncbi:germination protein, Ger(x)C family [Paenibacillus curdlanolyticus YK9]|uniref:Germination protein, Ger(X)C family n=1 Tax=Paenibacillus curdlanolyticus YK9 TaxID=717606 RepID=E0I611_9BACL|nr:Ger(x)C family spore germination protein [Paenibacillus curdlanolyticus]EFM12403.1 germination protein, Ger(x)C family [Paenibacillus curdlanolyticus YK9]
MKRIVRSISLMTLIFLSCLMQGCKDYNELNELAIVDMVGVDLNDDGSYQAYYQIVNPNGVAGSKSGSARSPLYTYEFKGKSWAEFSRLATQTLSRKLFISHFQAYIVSERLAKHGIGNLLNFLESDSRRRMATTIFVTKSPLKDVMNTYVPIEMNPGKELRSIEELQYEVTGASDNKSTVKTLLENFENNRLTYVSIIRLSGNKPYPTTKRFQSIEGNRGNFQFIGASIMKQGHAIGELHANQLETLFFLLGANKSFIQDIKWNEGDSAQLQMKGKPRVAYHLTIHDGLPKLDIVVKPKLELISIDQKEQLSTKTLHMLEKQFNKEMKKRALALIKLANKNEWDLLNIQERLANQISPKWAAIKANANAWVETEISVTVDSSIIKTGILLSPYQGGS